MIVQCATFSKSLNPRNIEKSVSDIRIRIWFPFQSSFWISLSSCKFTILPYIQPANRIVIISGSQDLEMCIVHTVRGESHNQRNATGEVATLSIYSDGIWTELIEKK